VKEAEDLFQTKEFKELPLCKRLWIRLVIAFHATISM